MNSLLDPAFVKQFRKLPKSVQQSARASYRLWRDVPDHPSLQFKRLRTKLPIYSVRIGIQYRALGVKQDDTTIVWFFIGSHADYDKVIARL